MKDEFITYQEAAEIIGVPQGTVYSWVSLKKIPHLRFGPRLVRFSRQELQKWIEKRLIPENEEKNEK